MKNKILLITFLILTLGCSPIPNTSVFENIETDKLAKIIKKDSSFAEFYDGGTKILALRFNDIEKAKFNDITWRKIYKLYKFNTDTIKVNKLHSKWANNWKNEFGIYEIKCDSIISYWKDYKEKNSPDNFVKIEFVEIYKDYYPYTDIINNIYLGFNLEPINKDIEEITFSYNFYNDNNSIEGRCIYKGNLQSMSKNYWKVNILDEYKISKYNINSFKKDYNINIEILNVKINGINYGENDSNIPKDVNDYFIYKNNKNINKYKNNIIKNMIYAEYKSKDEYIFENHKKYIKEKFPRQYEFYKLVRIKINRFI